MSTGEEYFRENYGDYERQNSRRKLDYYMGLVREHRSPGSRLHELGVGLGHFLARASSEYTCTGSDVNAFGIAETKRRAPRAILHQGSFEQIPTDPRPDVVVAWDVLEHLPNLPEALDCIRARLTDAGFLIGVVPVYDGPLGWLVHRLDHDPTHLSKWPREKWADELGRHGFEIVESGGIIRRLVMGRWYVFVTRPAPVLRWAGTALWFVARKKSEPSRSDASVQKVGR